MKTSAAQTALHVLDTLSPVLAALRYSLARQRQSLSAATLLSSAQRERNPRGALVAALPTSPTLAAMLRDGGVLVCSRRARCPRRSCSRCRQPSSRCWETHWLGLFHTRTHAERAASRGCLLLLSASLALHEEQLRTRASLPATVTRAAKLRESGCATVTRTFARQWRFRLCPSLYRDIRSECSSAKLRKGRDSRRQRLSLNAGSLVVAPSTIRERISGATLHS
ncbi:hypothetical protein HPB51_013824 [Rhipicephalus microplus]|uniref:Uncharacterized protein n=1 Tax=Rhipicephalus microplus TaxID=6941 RepID=A0A9J6F3N3_RHIMP|nr:hypothetical protein HPB51_013824 [Rhipicephalus microplus]